MRWLREWNILVIFAFDGFFFPPFFCTCSHFCVVSNSMFCIHLHSNCQLPWRVLCHNLNSSCCRCCYTPTDVRTTWARCSTCFNNQAEVGSEWRELSVSRTSRECVQRVRREESWYTYSRRYFNRRTAQSHLNVISMLLLLLQWTHTVAGIAAERYCVIVLAAFTWPICFCSRHGFGFQCSILARYCRRLRLEIVTLLLLPFQV